MPSPGKETRRLVQDRRVICAEGIHSRGCRCFASASFGSPPAPPDARKATPEVLAGKPADRHLVRPGVPRNPRPSFGGEGMHKTFPYGYQKKR